jgi:transmembrane sensor
MNAQIREEAAQWLVEFRTDAPDIAAKRQFVAWLRTSSEHVRAYLDVLAVWEDARLYDQAHKIDIDSLVALACCNPEVVDLRRDPSADAPAGQALPDIPAASSSRSRRTILRSLLRPRIAIAVFVSLLINASAAWFVLESQRTTYATDVGEQRSIRLSDGSRVDLDALSRVRVHFTRRERTVDLLSGEGLFHVTKDTSRPFVVHSDDAHVQAVGTQFDVNRTQEGTVVTVLEGRVAVRASSAPTRTAPASSMASESIQGTELDAGEQTTITRNTIAPPRTADIAVVTAWTRSLLIFDSTPLPDVADAFNRFNPRRLVIASRGLSNFHVTGTFRAFDPQSLPYFVRFLRSQPGIEVTETDDQITIQTAPISTR